MYLVMNGMREYIMDGMREYIMYLVMDGFEGVCIMYIVHRDGWDEGV